MSRLIYLADSLDATVDRLIADEELAGGALTHEKVRRSLESFRGDEIACSVFLKKYAVRDPSDRIIELTLNEAKNRWAREMGAAEERFARPRPTSHFRELYEYFLPAGRQMFALGNRHIELATYTNCLSGDTLVATSSGWRRMADLSGTVHDVVLHGRTLTARTWKTGRKNTVQLRTKEGYSVTSTPDHRFLLADGSWKRADQLQPDDKLVLSANSAPALDRDEAFWKGYATGLFVGVGTFAGDRFRVANVRLFDDKMALPVRRIAAIYGGDPIIKPKRISYNSTAWARDMEATVGIRHGRKRVMDGLFVQPLSYTRGFLSGLFDADGSVGVYKQKNGLSRGIVLSQSDRSFLESVQILLLSFGVFSSIYKKGSTTSRFPKGQFSCQQDWGLRISRESFKRFVKHIGFVHPAKQRRAEYGVFLGSFKADKGFARVKAVDAMGAADVYDMTVSSPQHAFPANGLVAHNCYVTETGDSLEGIFDAAYKIAKTYSYGGGQGLCIGKLRPAKARVSNSARFSTGAVSFMSLYSLVTGLIGQHGRRGALMITIPVDHPDIEEFLSIKHNNTDQIKYANISVKLTDEFMRAVTDDLPFTLRFATKHETMERTVSARALWQKIIQVARDSAEPGLMFWDKMVEMSPSDTYDRLKVSCTNPCVTGDTLVYVADGRGTVPIRQLAEKGEDVPVFCVDDEYRPVVRMMRNPRKTGENVPVYKVTLDDGSSFRATGNHVLCLTNGSDKEVKQLSCGDSLLSMTSYNASLEEVFRGSNSRSSDYRWVCVKGRTYIEHRMISAFQENKDRIPSGLVVHHKDYNSLNNSPSNLQVMTKEAHTFLHSRNMLGDKNPMRRAKQEWSEEKWDEYRQNMSKATSGQNNGRWDGISNDELRHHAIILTRELGRRFSHKDWTAYAEKRGLTEQFSKWRSDHFGGLLGLAKNAALECGIEHVDADPRTVRSYQKYTAQGYNCEIFGSTVLFIKKCEVCGVEFRNKRREAGICSQECHSKYMISRNSGSETSRKAQASMRQFYQEQKRKNGLLMVDAFLNLKHKLKRDPMLKELKAYCRDRGLKCRVGFPSYFSSYAELKDFAHDYNHRVVSVEPAGYEDVYNGTVDEFHKFAIGGWSKKTKSGKDKQNYIVVRQCGEQILSPGDACVLGSLLLHRFVKDPFTPAARFDFDLFRDMTARAVRHLDNVVELNLERHPLPEQQEAARLGRRIGLGITGLGDMFAALNIRYDSDEAVEFAEKLAETKKVTEYRASMALARERGAFPLFDPDKHYERGFCATLPEELKAEGREHGQRNVAISTIAPSGSLSIMAQCSSGIEPIFALSYKRYCELGNDRKEFTVRHPGWARCAEAFGDDEPCPDPWVVAHEIDYSFRVTLQGVLQRHIDASISSTINLPRDVSAETVGEIYLAAWAEGLKGVTVYREGSREGILVSDEFAQRAGDPHMDTIIHRVRAEGGDKFYIPVSYRDGDIRKPYQVFAMNYKATENDRFSTLARALIAMLREKGVCEDRIEKYLERSTSALARVTRFISLSLSTGHFDECYRIIDDHAYVGTLAAEFRKIFAKSLAAKRALCAKCSGSNVRMEEGCMHCLDCGWSGCN